MKRQFEQWLLEVWYGQRWLAKYLLLPLTALYCLLNALNRWQQQRQQVRHPVPVIVVGNLTAGGTGKTPLVIWLVELLRQAGYQPGVVSRGYQRQAAELGDEPLLIMQRTGVPLVVDRERNRAISTLLQQHGCNIVIADDGLQHYRMGRTLEICVVDGQRQWGNGWCLPAGPLRERVTRLQSCDFVVVNGTTMQMRGETLVALTGNTTQPLSALAGQQVHAVTGIGNPQRFKLMLEAAGLLVTLHPYPDHHAFTGEELQFDDDLPVLMTEKDAVKCREYAIPNAWYLPVEAVLADGFAQAVLSRLQGVPNG